MDVRFYSTVLTQINNQIWSDCQNLCAITPWSWISPWTLDFEYHLNIIEHGLREWPWRITRGTSPHQYQSGRMTTYGKSHHLVIQASLWLPCTFPPSIPSQRMIPHGNPSAQSFWCPSSSPHALPPINIDLGGQLPVGIPSLAPGASRSLPPLIPLITYSYSYIVIIHCTVLTPGSTSNALILTPQNFSKSTH